MENPYYSDIPHNNLLLVPKRNRAGDSNALLELGLKILLNNFHVTGDLE